jgi:4-hydroxy-3-methylbut-2-enyl diphosphate reductase
LVLGSEGSPATGELAETAHSTGKPVHVVGDPAQIRPDHLADAESVAITVSSSAPPRLCRAVVGALSGLGPMSLVLRRVSTETIPLDGLLPADAHQNLAEHSSPEQM